MKKVIVILFVFVTSFDSSGARLIQDERVLSERNCFSSFFSDYDSWRNQMKKKYELRAKSHDVVEQKLARFDFNFGKEKYELFKSHIECITFQYKVDSHLVKGFLVKPKSIEKELSVLIYNRGGNGNFGGVVFGSMMHNLFPIASQDFIVIGSQYRGTFTQSDTLDEFGGDDVNDVLALLDFIPSIKGADVDRIGMYGYSRGGMQTHLAVKETNVIKAIATIAGNTDLAKGLIYRPAMEQVYENRIPNYRDNKVFELHRRSVMMWVEELDPNIPILLIHGENDKRVSVKHSEVLAKALARNKIPYKLILFPEDNHSLMKNKEAVNRELVNWFKQHL